MESHVYIATAQKPTAVSHCVTGIFSNSKEVHLAVAKATFLEIHALHSEGLELLREFPLYGRVAFMQSFRVKGEQQDRLFVCTDTFKYFALSFDLKSGQVATKFSGDLKQKIGRKAEAGVLGAIDKASRYIAMHIYDGLIQVLALDAKGVPQKEAVGLRIEDHKVLQMCFLQAYATPTLMILYEDAKEVRRLKTYEVDLKTQRLPTGSWSAVVVAADAHLVVPVPTPFSGALVVGEARVTYEREGVTASIVAHHPYPRQITAWIMLDPTRYIIGDLMGNLAVVVLRHDSKTILQVTIEQLGQTSSARGLAYLDNGLLFVGSSFGDSQLIRLRTEKNQSSSFVDVLEEYTNIGPVVDMCVVDLDRYGQGELVTCSGAYKDGSLRVIRSGVRVTPEASIECVGIINMWSLCDSTPHHRYLVQSFLTQTRICAIDEEVLSEIRLEGFDHSAMTLHCANMSFGLILQVTQHEVRLIREGTNKMVTRWTPAQASLSSSSSPSSPSPVSHKISLATSNRVCVLIALSGYLCHLRIQPQTLEFVCTSVSLDTTASCICLSPDSEPQPGFAAVGTWEDTALRILKIPGLQEVHREVIESGVLPRSVCFAEFKPSIIFLLCGLGDGTLLTFQFDQTKGASSHRSQSIGTRPLLLTTLQSVKGNEITSCVFVCCDRPTLIHLGSEGKLTFANVDLEDVSFLAPFSSALFPDCVAYVAGRILSIGSIDSLQRLHIRKIPLGEQPRRMAFQKSTLTFAVGTIKTRDGPPIDDGGVSNELGFVHLIDSKTYSVMDSHQLEAFESIGSLINAKFDGGEYFFVGTAYALPDEPEPTQGRILCFLVEDRRLRLVGITTTKGAVYCMSTLQDNKLVAGINSKIQVYSWGGLELADADMSGENNSGVGGVIKPECACHGNIIVLCLQVQGDYVIVGDMMTSVSVLGYSADTNSIRPVAKDFDANWMTAVEVLKDDVYLGADASSNFFVLSRDRNSQTLARAMLRCIGRFHVGEFVNVFRRGSLAMNLSQEEDERVVGTHLFACISGAIGIVAPLSQKQYPVLSRLSSVLEGLGIGVGGLSHADWRAFSNDRKVLPASRFVDGDLLQTFQSLPESARKQAAVQAGVDVEALSIRVESLGRLF